MREDMNEKNIEINEEKNEVKPGNILTTIFENLITLICIVLHYILIIFTFNRLDENMFMNITKFFSLGVLIITIIIFEISYKKDSGKGALYGIEALMIAINTLIINNMMKRFNISFQNYLIISMSVFLIYYIFKIVILYTQNRKRYLESLSDIRDIVK